MSSLLIDVTRLVGRLKDGRIPTGIDRVSLAYVQHFRDRALALVRVGKRTVRLTSKDSLILFDLLLAPPPDFARRAILLIWWSYLKPQPDERLHGALLFNTGHSGLEQARYPSLLRRQRVRPLFVVHDLIPVSHPEYCRDGERNRHVTRIRNMLELASGIISNSQSTMDELRRFAARADLDVPPSIVALLGGSLSGTPSLTRPIDEPYFVILGTIEARKNHILLLEVWRKLSEKRGSCVPRLVIIGHRGWECENVIDMLERCEALRDIVIELPLCSDADLQTWLHHAQALLFPSFAEGFGKPLVEALEAGVPVIASDLPIFREVAGDIPDYLDPLDGLGWMQQIEAYALPDSVVRDSQIKRLAHFDAPTWNKHFATVDAWMERFH